MGERDIFERVPSTDTRVPAPPPTRRGAWVNVALFVLTFLSALWSQVRPQSSETLSGAWLAAFGEPSRLLPGFSFAVVLMAILLAHEMGHYLTARRYGVEQSLPYFIPAPTIFGTLGAVIVMRSLPPSRSALLNVAVAGPFAGLILAVVASAWGLAHSLPVQPAFLSALPDQAPYSGGTLLPLGLPYVLGTSPLFGLLRLCFGPGSAGVVPHPVALAGWVGLFVTSLNLIPAAQLDGGHVAYALFGRRHRRVGLLVVVALFLTGLLLVVAGGYAGNLSRGLERGFLWIFWAALLMALGLRHPPVRDEAALLTRGQRRCGYFAFVVFLLTFTPVPIETRDAALMAPGFESMAPWQQPHDQGGEQGEEPLPHEEFRL